MSETMRTCVECGGTFSSRYPRRCCSAPCEFWSRVDRSAGPDGCWPWTGHVSPTSGYGDVPARYASGKRSTAHRHAWKLHNCCDPGQLQVLHRCDFRVCCNPAHLRLGTQRENIWDALSKGRRHVCLPGEAHSKARLTDDIVREIRAAPDRVKDLAERYGVSPQTIRQARKGRTWRHLPLDAAE